MDDRELEARLKTRLHARFDDAPVPADISSDIRRSLTVLPVRFRFGTVARGTWVGWTAVAAAAALAVAGLLGSRMLGPATPVATTPVPAVQVPLPTPSTKRLFMVLPQGALPEKAITTRAVDVLEARLRALGVANFTSSVGFAITFQIPADGPSDDLIRAVLAAPGVVEFVPVPPDAYESLAPVAGDTLPADLPSLFGPDGLATVGRGTSVPQGLPTLDITLTAPAAAAFGEYTAAHSREYIAIVVDGKIATMPVISEPIPGGNIQISGGGPDPAGRPDTAWQVASAIMIGGRLPEEWQGARVPGIVNQDFANRAAMGQLPAARFVSSELTAEADGDGWRAVWVIEVAGVVSAVIPCPTEGPGHTCFVPGSTRRVIIDAERGTLIRIETPPE